MSEFIYLDKLLTFIRLEWRQTTSNQIADLPLQRRDVISEIVYHEIMRFCHRVKAQMGLRTALLGHRMSNVSEIVNVRFQLLCVSP